MLDIGTLEQIKITDKLAEVALPTFVLARKVFKEKPVQMMAGTLGMVLGSPVLVPWCFLVTGVNNLIIHSSKKTPPWLRQNQP